MYIHDFNAINRANDVIKYLMDIIKFVKISYFIFYFNVGVITIRESQIIQLFLFFKHISKHCL